MRFLSFAHLNRLFPQTVLFPLPILCLRSNGALKITSKFGDETTTGIDDRSNALKELHERSCQEKYLNASCGFKDVKTRTGMNDSSFLCGSS